MQRFAPVLATVVHTTGINWESIGVISTIVLTVSGGAAKWITGRVERNRETTRDQITAIGKALKDELGQVNVKLEKTNEHLQSQGLDIRKVSERVATVEGKLSVVPPAPTKASAA